MAKKAIGEVKRKSGKIFKADAGRRFAHGRGRYAVVRKTYRFGRRPGLRASAPVLAILIWAPAILFVYIPLNSLVISQLTKKAVLITGINVIVNTWAIYC